MKYTLKLLFALALLLNSNSFFAQQAMTPEQMQAISLNKVDSESIKSSKEYQKKLEDDQKRIRKEQNKALRHQKELIDSQKDIQKTNQKIEQLEAQNQKVSNKITTRTLSPKEAQKQQVKLKENELAVQKLKLKKIDQQKKLEKLTNK